MISRVNKVCRVNLNSLAQTVAGQVYVLRLTEKLMNKLQNLYGIAVRENVNKTVHQLKVAFGAVLYHSTELENSESRFCPRDPDSWCKCWKDPNNYQEKKECQWLFTNLLSQFFQILNETYILNVLMEKPKTPMNRLTTLYGTNAQRIFIFNETFLQSEYHLRSLTLMIEIVVY